MLVGLFFLTFSSGLQHSTALNTSKLGESGLVTYIVDGDTFDVEGLGRIRLADVNTPELGETGYQEAKDYTHFSCYQKTVYLDIDDLYITGPYGRYIAVVYIPYNATHLVNFNQILLKTRLAIISDYDNEFDPSVWLTGPIEYIKNEELSQTENQNLEIIAGLGLSIVLVVIFALLFWIKLRKVKFWKRKYKEKKANLPLSLKKSYQTSNSILSRKEITNLRWGKWKFKTRKRYRTAIPNQAFWHLWRQQKQNLKDVGITVWKKGDTWFVTHWDTIQ